jgi:hypothetical protein
MIWLLMGTAFQITAELIQPPISITIFPVAPDSTAANAS